MIVPNSLVGRDSRRFPKNKKESSHQSVKSNGSSRSSKILRFRERFEYNSDKLSNQIRCVEARDKLFDSKVLIKIFPSDYEDIYQKELAIYEQLIGEERDLFHS